MPRSAEAAVRVRDLVQGYGKRTVIDRLSLDIRPGVSAILGLNGAGKTTLLRTLATELAPKRGELWIEDICVRNFRQLRAARQELGFLPQNFTADPLFTARDLVRYAAWLRQAPRIPVPFKQR